MVKYVDVGDVNQTTESTWEWTIKDYKPCYAVAARVLYSAKISAVDHYGNTNWLFKVYPKRLNVPDKLCVGVHIANLDKTDVTANVIFSVVMKSNSSGVFLYSYDPMKPFEFNAQKKCHGVDIINQNLLNDRTLHIKIQIFVVRPDILTVFANNEKNNCTNRLEDDFEKLLSNPKHSDVTFTFDDKQIYLHKAILASRSSVFEAMFLDENLPKVVNITDTRLEIFKEMCRFIYSGRVNDIDRISKDLLITADKYCLEGLRNLCERTICNQVNRDNVVEYFMLKKMYSTNSLKSIVFECIKTNIHYIYEKPEFKKLDAKWKDEIIGILIGKSN